MPKSPQALLAVTAILCLLFTGVLLLVPPDVDHSDTADSVRSSFVDNESRSKLASPALAPASKEVTPANTNQQDNLGTYWRNAPSPEQVGIDKNQVLNALTNIRVDEAGNLVVDHEGLQSLHQSLGYGLPKVDPQQLAAIQSIIADNLPEPTAGQTLVLVDNFYAYLNAKRELEALYPSTRTSADLDIYLAELNALRELIFGRRQTQQLFHQQHKHEQYMLENLRLVENSELTESQRSAARRSLKEQYFSNNTSSSWDARLETYTSEKRIIEQAALSDMEKNLQLQQLRNNYFNKEEQALLPDFNRP